MGNRIVRALAAGLLAASVLPCGGPAAAQGVKLKIGSGLSPISLDSITPYVALERGLFRKYGLDVQIVEFRGSPTNMKALLAGEDRRGPEHGGHGCHRGSVQGGEDPDVGRDPTGHTPYHFVARKEAGTTLHALMGRSVAVSGIGAVSYHIPRMVLERTGVDPDKLKYVAVGSPADRFKAIVAGKVDATVVTNAEAAKLDQHAEIASLAQVPKILSEIPYEVGVAKEEYIEKNPDTILRLTKALLEANRWIAANKAGTVEIAARLIKDESPDILARAYDLGDPHLWAVNGGISEAAYKFTSDFLIKVGYMQSPILYDRFFDRRFVDRALKELGRP